MSKKNNEEWVKVEIGDAVEWEEIGQEIVGILKNIRRDVGENKSIMYEIEEEDGSIISIWGSTILDNRMIRVDVGDKVKIIYKGKKQSQKNKTRSFHDFEVFHKKLLPPL